MNILLTNDDGINSPGINALADALSGRHEISIVAPSHQRSASAHAITVHDPISFERLESKKIKNYYSVGGTPADCVKLAALFLFKNRLPDLVIAGINEGSNLGCDTIYSGTVSAALEAAYMGMKGIAVSQYSWGGGSGGYSRAAKFIADNLENFFEIELDKYSVLNVNHPDAQAEGVVTAKLGQNYYSDYYAAVDKSMPNRVQLRGNPLEVSDADSDVAWARKNYITVTPITIDRNDYGALDRIKGLKFRC